MVQESDGRHLSRCFDSGILCVTTLEDLKLQRSNVTTSLVLMKVTMNYANPQ